MKINFKYLLHISPPLCLYLDSTILRNLNKLKYLEYEDKLLLGPKLRLLK